MSNKSFSVRIKHKIKPFSKTIKVDSDKSLSIRSFLLGSICQNISTVNNVLESGDVKSAIKTCQKLKLDTLFVGEEFSKLSNTAFEKLIDLKKFIKLNPIKNKTILLKGSRGIGLEGLVNSL